MTTLEIVLSLTIGATVGAVVLTAFIQLWRDRRRRRLAREAIVRRFAARPRGKVVKIGTIVTDCLGREHPYGFVIDCEGHVPAVQIGPDGEHVMAGYTAEELLEMAKRRAEFET